MKFKKIILYDLKSEPLDKEFVDKLKNLTESVKIVFAENEYSKGLKLSDLENADCLITRLFDFYDETLFTESKLKYVGAMHTDVSHFNIDILNKKGITLTSVPRYATEAVAELTISALLNISRQTHDAMSFVKNGNWGFEKFLGWELNGKTLGIIGLGAIGNRVSEIAKCFGMKIIHYTPSKKDENFLELDNLLKQSDVVSLHCPLTDETKNILDKTKLELMKKNSVLLNPGRSELVDLNTLYKLCEQNKISAWFEAIEEKEVRKKFGKLNNIYLTPHFGWMTKEAQDRLKNITLNNIRSFLEKNLKTI